MPDAASWPYIIASTIIHFGYYYLLNRSYRLGDLSLVYPVARGIAPVLVTMGAALTAGEWLGPLALSGVGAVSLGVIALATRGAAGGHARATIGVAIGTGLMIAAYSVVDGLGVRRSGAPLGYIGWLFIFEIFVAGFVFLHNGHRVWRKASVFLPGLVGGLVSAGAYGLVIWAKNVAPLGLVSSLRETSVVFATLIGVVFLRERPWQRRTAASLLVLLGAVLIAFA
ncbi:MAG: EamA family transporter [Paracoccaceae bacterium]